MEVLNSSQITSNNPARMDEALAFVPGVSISDGQLSIRGGSGYSYGTGSRVQVLLDGMPVLSPDAGDVKWNFLPLENLSSVEIIKGASSSLYGSSALNGVINILTAYPGPVPESALDLYNGIYLSPARKELKWWDSDLRFFSSTSFSHSSQIGPLDLVTGIHFYHNNGYRTENQEDRFRYNLRLRYRHSRIKGLTYGFGTSVFYQEKSDFLLWLNAAEGGYIQDPSSVSPGTGYRIMIDPFITFYDKAGGRHALKSRVFSVGNDMDGEKQDNSGAIYMAEYTYGKELNHGFRITTGSALSAGITKATLFGDHNTRSFALFGQVEKTLFGELHLSGGVRWETIRTDHVTESSRPLVRAGANYQIAPHSFFRASFGQGYRIPTIAEKFTYTQIGALQVLPNPHLQPESGWSTEAGFRQEFMAGRFKGYLDLATFLTGYEEMMEFTFGVYDSVTWEPIYNPLLYGENPVGFQSRNVSQARISGIELVIGGEGSLGVFPVSVLVGYTFTDPVDLNTDSIYNLGKSNNTNVLKYRFRHSFTFMSQVEYRRFTLGIATLFNSHIENIDKFFELGLVLPGLKDYRDQHNKGFIRTDASLSWKMNQQLTISFLIKNLFNEEYLIRPGDIGAPRNIAFRLQWKI
jgi:outer membrane receptor protein involved in Fe transport